MAELLGAPDILGPFRPSTSGHGGPYRPRPVGRKLADERHNQVCATHTPTLCVASLHTVSVFELSKDGNFM